MALDDLFGERYVPIAAEAALHEMPFSGGVLNARVLGGVVPEVE